MNQGSAKEGLPCASIAKIVRDVSQMNAKEASMSALMLRNANSANLKTAKEAFHNA